MRKPLFLLIPCLFLTACGQTGPLYLPTLNQQQNQHHQTI